MGPSSGRRRILVLYWAWGPLRPSILHHLRSIAHAPRGHEVFYFNAAVGCPRWLRLLPFDAIILHTTFLCLRWSDRFSAFKRKFGWLPGHPAVKIALPQDEYDHSAVLDEWLEEMGTAAIGTNFSDEHRGLLYPRMSTRATFHLCLTGYIDAEVADRARSVLRPLADRPLDIVYRAAHLPFWFGSQGQLKHELATVIAQRAQPLGLRCDISTHPQDTILGPGWFDFLASARCTIGCESGSSCLDPSGAIAAAVRRLLAQQPALTFDQASALLPSGWDDHRFVAISPRHFEAVITRTCQVLVEGRYSGVLVPHLHYISLRRDFSNLDEVLHQVRDTALLERITDRAYEDIHLSGRYTYDCLAEVLDQAMDTHLPGAGTSTGSPSVPPAAVRSVLKLGEVFLRAGHYLAKGMMVLSRFIQRFLPLLTARTR